MKVWRQTFGRRQNLITSLFSALLSDMCICVSVYLAGLTAGEGGSARGGVIRLVGRRAPVLATPGRGGVIAVERRAGLVAMARHALPSGVVARRRLRHNSRQDASLATATTATVAVVSQQSAGSSLRSVSIITEMRFYARRTPNVDVVAASALRVRRCGMIFSLSGFMEIDRCRCPDTVAPWSLAQSLSTFVIPLL